ncbi:FAD-dependent monooxygenase [Sphingomonas sp. KR1UV-12]|uniref:FAD-dependent monooxygenase n=1 Tax=Sphingomonas aurea TaxID=3063994 RepID=A0ABT9EMH5_9SPHN|nr:FAD-dependent monooxygenase [Sphingomonas sp. KR1UV-12]MDP1027848.1 FAD-dependent monooxygenase [Sphingomonas sp. KR1UV-12]
MRRTGPLIVGGGPAGAAAAIALAAAGERPLLLERTAETGDALCGGFLSWRSLAALARLGIEADALNRERIGEVRVFAGGRRAVAPLPWPALAVSRRTLDAALLAQVDAVERGVAVRSVEDGALRLADGAALMPAALFLATGKHDLRGLARPAAARGSDPTLGLRVRLPGSPALDRLVGPAIELHLFARGYAGIARQEDGGVNLCMAVHRSRLDAAGSPAALLAMLAAEAPDLGERLSFMTSEPVQAVANVPYGWRARAGTAGLFRLGDQAAVIPSLAGEGMGIALASGIAAAGAHARGGGAAARAWQPHFAARVRRPMAVAGLLRRLAEGAAAPWLVRAATPGLIQIMAAATRIDHDAPTGA